MTMNLGKYVYELLQNHECVVLPGFGGFITRNEGATIHPVQNLFTPPARKILFNEQLVGNDGLLAAFVAETEQVDYATAMQRITFSINELLFELYKNKEVTLSQIGRLTINGTAIQFHCDAELLLQDETYGLPTFIMPLVQRERKQPPQQIEPIVPAGETPKIPLKRYVSIAASIVVLLGCVSYLWFAKPHNEFNISSLLPNISSWLAPSNTGEISLPDNLYTGTAPCHLFDSMINIAVNTAYRPDITINANFEETAMTTTETQPENLTEPVTSETTQIAETEAVAEAIPQEIVPTGTKKYYIIGASYDDRDKAVARCEKVKALGYTSEVIDAPKIGRFRVSVGCFTTREAAESFLEQVRIDYRSDAWLLVVKQ